MPSGYEPAPIVSAVSCLPVMINNVIQSQLQLRDSDRFVDNILRSCHHHHLCPENHTNSEGDCMGLLDVFRLLCS